MLVEIPAQETALEDARRFLANGNWRKAERACEGMLALREDAQAAFLLGQVYVASGQPNRALEWFQKAISWDPSHAEAHFSCAEVSMATGDPHSSAQSWLAGIEIDPTPLRAHLGLADALLALELFDMAAIAAKQALLVDSTSADALERLGRAAELDGNRHQAIQALEQCDLLRPLSVENLRTLANLHASDGKPQQSEILMSRTVRLQPRNPGLRFEFANILARLGKRAEALHELREAVRLKPKFPEALSNMGMLLRANGQFLEAENVYKKACSQNPKFALAWNNLANLHIELVNLDEAERCYAHAIDASPDYAEAHTGRAMLQLLRGNFAEGWNEYEWRWKQPGKTMRDFGAPSWDGSTLDGQTILLHSEQGAGDTIQFIRYARILKRQGARVILHCQSSLRSLLEPLPELDEVLCGSESIPLFDRHAPLMSLPRLCGTDLAAIPADIPYLSVPTGVTLPEAVTNSKKLKVGLVWAGNPNHHNDRNRSLSPSLLEPLLATEGIQFFSLQVGGAPLSDSITCNQVVDLSPHPTNYAVTATCLAHLDLLITVDTSVAHLAGALGIPVWMMLPACNDWRWLLDRSDSPWYPTMRIFRQQKGDDWGNVVKVITAECRSLVKEAD